MAHGIELRAIAQAVESGQIDLGRLRPDERSELDALLEAHRYRWAEHARPEQLEPAGDRWDKWLILTGRGWGKTRTGAETIRRWKDRVPRIHLVAPTAADARDTMVEGPAGILAVSPPWDRPKYEPSKRRLTWRNGAIAVLFSADEPERLRGPQCGAYWCDELAAWRYCEETWDMLQFGARLGQQVRGIITTTPRPIKVLKQIIQDPKTVITRGHTLENRANLAPNFIQAILDRYQGTRLGRQELEGQILDDNPAALWRRAWFERTRTNTVPELVRVVVGVDPQAGKGEEAAETGIIVVGRAWTGDLYILGDYTIQGTPSEWAARVRQAYDEHEADLIVAEKNNGGEMVRHTIQTARLDLPIKLVSASRGKRTRAEPVSLLTEQGRVHPVGAFPALEDQCCEWDPNDPNEDSPDRLDAFVWAVTELTAGQGGLVGVGGYDPLAVES